MLVSHWSLHSCRLSGHFVYLWRLLLVQVICRFFLGRIHIIILFFSALFQFTHMSGWGWVFIFPALVLQRTSVDFLHLRFNLSICERHFTQSVLFLPSPCVFFSATMSAPLIVVWKARAGCRWAFFRLHRPLRSCTILNPRLHNHVLSSDGFPWDVGGVRKWEGVFGVLAVHSF